MVVGLTFEHNYNKRHTLCSGVDRLQAELFCGALTPLRRLVRPVAEGPPWDKRSRIGGWTDRQRIYSGNLNRRKRNETIHRHRSSQESVHGLLP